MRIQEQLYALRQEGRKGFAVLIDPDKVNEAQLSHTITLAQRYSVDFLFVGGSLLVNAQMNAVIRQLKAECTIPVVIFPGSVQQVDADADAILFLSLISGRNPDLLIGSHVLAAPMIRQANLEAVATGYILIDTGKATTVHYISNTQPIPYDKPDIALCTAMAGELLGLKVIYMDGGSGALKSISSEMIEAVSNHTEIPLIIGGGIRSAGDAKRIWEAGADVIVIGNAIERDPEGRLMRAVSEARHEVVKI